MKMTMAEAIERQHKKGKLHISERMKLLFDNGEYVDLTYVDLDGNPQDQSNYDGVIAGYGNIEGKKVYVVAQDFTFRGGSLGEKHGRKIVEAQKRALKDLSPVIFLNDSGGARIQEGIAGLAMYGEIFKQNTDASGIIPQISVILGPCAGGAVYSPGLNDYVVMVDNISHAFVTGPDVVQVVLNREVTSEELGGAAVHSEKSGVAHLRAASEADCVQLIRDLIAMIPANNCQDVYQNYNPALRERTPEKPLDTILPERPNRGYDIRDIINNVFDEGSFLEVHKGFAPSMVVGYAKLAGITTGIIANQPRAMAGVLDINSSDKAARFVRLCDCFNVPIATFTDVPGYLPGIEQEYGGIIRHGAKLIYAFCEATVPKVNFIVRKAYGGAYIAMNSRHLGADRIYVWPSAEIAVMGAPGAVSIIYAREVKTIPEAERAAFLAEKEAALVKASRTYDYGLESGFIDEVIDPKDTREKLLDAFLELKDKKVDAPAKKHGNIPM